MEAMSLQENKNLNEGRKWVLRKQTRFEHVPHEHNRNKPQLLCKFPQCRNWTLENGHVPNPVGNEISNTTNAKGTLWTRELEKKWKTLECKRNVKGERKGFPAFIKSINSQKERNKRKMKQFYLNSLYSYSASFEEGILRK